MLEAIGKKEKYGVQYNWVDHVDDLIKNNYQDFHNSGKVIRFPSLLIWVTMKANPPIGEAEFTKKYPTIMNNFKIFSSIWSRESQSLGPNKIFRNWMLNIKNISDKWRIFQLVHHDLPPFSHIQLCLDYTSMV